jgi:UDP-N-acetylmuramoyl-tripeptide--D-alanyl-D-alanine ligase
MVASVLSQKYKTQKTIGNHNNHIGVPLTLFQLQDDDEVIVVEMGMNHAGEISVLSQAAAPDIAVITNIGDAHIENFENREGILRAKLEITDGLKPNGVFIVNGDDPLLSKQSNAIKCRLDEALVAPLGIEGSQYTYGDTTLHIPQPGKHMVMNALLAAKVGELLGLTPEQIKDGIAAFTPSENRMEVISAHGMKIINDAYNANPSAMKATLEILQYADGRKVAILGDMFELGDRAQALHREVGLFAAEQGVTLIAIGTLAKHMADAYNEVSQSALHFPDKAAFLSQWKAILKPGDTVLIKASNGMAFMEIVKELTQ